MKKAIIRFLAVATMACSLGVMSACDNVFSFLSSDKDKTISLIDEAGIEYTLINDGKAYAVAGVGTAKDTAVVIPDTFKGLPVVEIAQMAFFEKDITSIELSSQIEKIGSAAFEKTRLKSVVFSSNSRLEIIEDGAFRWCEGLKSIKLPQGLEVIGEGAFELCSGLTSVTLPKSLEILGNRAFENCESLTKVNLNKGLVSIGDYVFSGTNLTGSLTIPSSVADIGRGTFWECEKITEIIFEETTGWKQFPLSYEKVTGKPVYEETVSEWKSVSVDTSTKNATSLTIENYGWGRLHRVD